MEKPVVASTSRKTRAQAQAAAAVAVAVAVLTVPVDVLQEVLQYIDRHNIANILYIISL
jgi:ribose 1,5-bisphosphokinase PhnN